MTESKSHWGCMYEEGRGVRGLGYHGVDQETLVLLNEWMEREDAFETDIEPDVSRFKATVRYRNGTSRSASGDTLRGALLNLVLKGKEK